MSTAWYKSKIVPTLLQEWSNRSRKVQVWSTTCIVTNFGKQLEKNRKFHHHVLINPANPQLSGVKSFPYFPRGGPVPAKQPEKDAHHIMGYVTSWGGMEVGSGMLFSMNVVDGMVHQLGGYGLAWEIALLASPGRDVKCAVGQAVVTGARGDLIQMYDRIVHTVPPFYREVEKREEAHSLLLSCYKTSLELASTSAGRDSLMISTPLLGAGCRGFPRDEAIDVASEAASEWLLQEKQGDEADCVLAFGVPDPLLQDELVTSLESYL